eukprot:g16093.t1
MRERFLLPTNCFSSKLLVFLLREGVHSLSRFHTCPHINSNSSPSPSRRGSTSFDFEPEAAAAECTEKHYVLTVGSAMEYHCTRVRVVRARAHASSGEDGDALRLSRTRGMFRGPTPSPVRQDIMQANMQAKSKGFEN